MRALSIRQPFAELILRGVKTVEYRTRPTRVIGERFHIYATKGSGFRVQGSEKIWSRDLAMPAGELPAWMAELAEQVLLIGPEVLLPRGVIVGSAVIAECRELPVTRNQQPATRFYEWHLTGVERAKQFRKPTRHPQPVWFRPF